MGFKIKKAIMILVVLSIFISGIIALIPFLLGMHHGYDAAVLKTVVENNCDCQVSALKENISNTDLIKDLKSKKRAKTFSLQLANCKYQSLDHLKQDILNALKKQNLCLDLTISFKVLMLDSNAQIFNINNCNL